MQLFEFCTFKLKNKFETTFNLVFVYFFLIQGYKHINVLKSIDYDILKSNKKKKNVRIE